MTDVEKIWNKTKRNFVLGKDYIETETRGYIVFCPFNYAVLAMFREYLDDIERTKCRYRMSHCVCESVGAYIYWYKVLYQDGRLKTFFISKKLNIKNDYEEQPKLAEFTGWIDFSDRHFLHFAHLVDNKLATGEYHNFEGEYAYNRNVNSKYKKYVERMNELTSEVYDSLFEQYDKYIDKLEETLHNVIDDFENG